MIGCRYQSRAFLLLPMCANVGIIVGPLIGGITSDPAANYPDLFGGIRWLERFPYALPNIISALFLCSALLLVFFGLEEVNITIAIT
jgi:MFS family permease